MLRHLGEQAAAERVETALREVIAEGRRTTYDLGGEPARASSRTRSSSGSARPDRRPAAAVERPVVDRPALASRSARLSTR